MFLGLFILGFGFAFGLLSRGATLYPIVFEGESVLDPIEIPYIPSILPRFLASCALSISLILTPFIVLGLFLRILYITNSQHGNLPD